MASSDLAAKAAGMLSRLDANHPTIAPHVGEPDAAARVVQAFAERRSGRFNLEFDQRPAMTGYLEANYPAWRRFDYSPAERYRDMSLEDARGGRATSGIAALGQAWLRSGDPAWGKAFERFFIESATGEMFTWYSFNGSQPVAEMPAYFLLLDCPGFSTQGRIAFLDHLFAIADDAWDTHASQWPQTGLGTEGHNWYLHGMHALPAIAAMFPELKRAEFFRTIAWSVVEEHVRGHLKADGGARETTLGYQAGSMNCLWDMYLIAHRNGVPMSPRMADRLLHATHFVLRLATPDGSLPSFGDTHPTPGMLTTLAAIAAAVTGDGWCRWWAERFRPFADDGVEDQSVIPYNAFWKVGLAGAETYAATRPRDPGHRSVLMGPTGYTAMRDGDDHEAAYLAIAHADRGPIVTSHGHNDIFALDIHAGGTRFLGEMGCAGYGESPGRDFDQLTRAHSTVVVNGMEQVEIINEWRWGGVVTPAVRRWISEPTHDVFHAAHEGFYRFGDHPIIHARKVVFIKSARAGGASRAGSSESYWIVLDWIETTLDSVDIETFWHGAVPGRLDGVNVILQAAGDPANGRLAILPAPTGGLSARPFNEPGRDAYLAMKKIDPASVSAFAHRASSGRTCLAWVIVPLGADEPLPSVEALPVNLNGADVGSADAMAVRVQFPGCTDTLAFNHRDYDGAMIAGDIQATGMVAFERAGEGGEILRRFVHTTAEGDVGR